MKKKATLIYPGKLAHSDIFHKTASLRLPLSLLCIARPLLDNGYQVDIVDMRVREFNLDDASESICFGISAMTGSQILHGIDIAKRIRDRFPEKMIVWGGIHPTIFPKQTIKSGYADIVVRHEGDITFLELVDGIYRGGIREDVLNKIEGITWRGKDNVIFANKDRPLCDMNKLNLPAYELIDMDRYYNIRNSFDYQSSRGCPFACKFCYNESFNFQRWRAKGAEQVVDEMMFLYRKYNINCFATVDDEMFISSRRANGIADGLIGNDSPFQWSGFCRFDTFSRFKDELIKKLKLSGVDQLFFGAESGNIKTLEFIKKQITLDQIETTLSKAKKFGIRPVVSFVAGFPGETKDSINDTLRLYDRIIHKDCKAEINGIFIYTPYPGTGLYNIAVDSGFQPPQTLEEWGKWKFNYNINHPWLSKDLIMDIRNIGIIARFRFFSQEFINRNRDRAIIVRLFKVLNLPFSILAFIRWRKRFFKLSLEWQFWAFLVKKVFGSF